MSIEQTREMTAAKPKKPDKRRIRTFATWQRLCNLDDGTLELVFWLSSSGLALMKADLALDSSDLVHLGIGEHVAVGPAPLSHSTAYIAVLQAFRLAPKAYQEQMRPWFVRYIKPLLP